MAIDEQMDPAALHAMFLEQDAERDPEPYKVMEPEPKAEPEAVKEPVEKKDEVAEQEPEGIATKDGKHVIPYSVLKSERERAAAAERLMNDMRAEIDALKAERSAPNQGVKDGESARTSVAPAETDMSDEELAALDEDFPTVTKAIRAMKAQVASLRSTLDPAVKSFQDQENARVRSQGEVVQDAIDSIPKLSHIQSSDPEAFAMAQQFDTALRGQKQWADRPIAERFAKVIELVEQSMGEIAATGQPQAPATAAQKQALKETASALVAKAPKSVPTSLSQFPAGEPVATDEAASLEQMTHAQVAEKLSRMTPAQQDAFYASL